MIQLLALVAGHTAPEAALVFGAVRPGPVALLGISALVFTGAIALWPALTAANAVAIARDGWPYWLGHRHRERILQVWPFSQIPHLVSGSAALHRAHPVKSIVIACFTVTNGPPRPVLIGTVVRQALRRPIPFPTVSVALPDAVGPRNALAQALGRGRIVMRPRTPTTSDPDWGAHVLAAPEPVTVATGSAVAC